MRLVMLCLALTAAYGQDGPFSHKKHAPLRLACTYCHAGAEKAERASFPTIATCRTCHPMIAERKIPAQRIYKLKEFVVFSHVTHTAARMACDSCHGQVYTMETLGRPARPTTMIECVECHKANKASVQCNICHELGQ